MLIMKKGNVVYSGNDWDEIENYPSIANEVCLFRFEAGPEGKMSVAYRDEAIALVVVEDHDNLLAYLEELHANHGWPRPRTYGTRLPRIGIPNISGNELDDAEEEEAEIPVQRRRRTRVVQQEEQHEQVPETRKRRSRTVPAKRSRIRAG